MRDVTQSPAPATVTLVRRERPRRHWLRLFAGITLVLALVAGVGLHQFAQRVVYHAHYDPVPTEQVDVLFVLGPLDTWRVDYAKELMSQGVAKNLVLSTPNPSWDQRYCGQDAGWPVYCFPPNPSTTRGEAQNLRELAAKHGWTTFTIVTVDVHAARTRFIMKRCLRQDIPVVGVHWPMEANWLRYQVLYQLGGYAKEIALGRC